jgi:hypothetical protein
MVAKSVAKLMNDDAYYLGMRTTIAASALLAYNRGALDRIVRVIRLHSS